MKKWALLAVALSAMVVSCCSTVYVEEPTPRGTVPPAEPAPQRQSMPASDRGRQASVEAAPPITDAYAETVRRFQVTYAARKRPRIAVFLNRALSDEVQEWRTRSRLVLAAKSEESRTKTEKDTETARNAERQGALAAYVQTHGAQQARPAPPEDWMWQFEDSFLREFLSARALIVDRATILRLVAEADSDGLGPSELTSVKNIEVKALREKADLLMEILVRRNPRAPLGHEFRASVKEIPTGRILALVTSLEWKQHHMDLLTGPSSYKATSRGYVRVGDDGFPALDRVATILALDVMHALTNVWKEEKH